MLSIVIPCYNEALNIPHIHAAFKNCIRDRKDIEVLIVNNGSKDNSSEVLQTMVLNDPSNSIFRVVHVPENKGYGHGILSGLKEAKGDILAWTHADLQTDPSDVIKGYEKYLEHNNESVFVKGKRKDRKLHAWFFSWGMQLLSSWALKNNLDDINAQPKVFSRKFYDTYLANKAPYDFSLDLYAHYWAAKMGKVIDIPVVVNERLHGEAKGGGSVKTKVKLIYRTFNYIFDLRRKLAKEPNV